MRTVLLGSDFMYNAAGKLVPIEINTNLGMLGTPIEEDDNIFDLTQLSSFIIANNFIKVTYIGSIALLNGKLKELCTTLGITYELLFTDSGVTVPYVEDEPNVLIIRTAYDITAIVDEEYCKNKIHFMNLIKGQPFSSQFAYVNDDGILVNNITSIPNNGTHPNFILKSVYPRYKHEEYPMLFRVSNQDELNVILSGLTNSYYITEFHYNPDKLFNGNMLKIIRTFNLLFPPNLNSLSMGHYTNVSRQILDESSVYDPITFQLNPIYRNKYLSSEGENISHPKLLDSDQVQMADGTFKSAIDLQVDEIVKTIAIANPHGTDLSNPCNDFLIDYDTFTGGTVYDSNRIIAKNRIDRVTNYVFITFTDGTTWEDTSSSSYLVLRNDNDVRFSMLTMDIPVCGIKLGDKIILIDASKPELTTVLKEVQSIVVSRQIFSGWEITIEENHLFLTKAEDSESSYVSIEHNPGACGACKAQDCTLQCSCLPGKCCCSGYVCLGSCA